MPAPLPNLYCTPNDVYDYLSVEGTQLRLDDHNQASGQQIQATADALAGATSIQVAGLALPLLAGSSLVFDGAGMVQTSTAVLAAVGKTGDTTLTVQPLTVQVNNGAAARDSGINLVMGQRLVKSTQYATAQVKLYCTGRYNDSDLANSWSVNRWATVLASRWVGRRRALGCPRSIEKDAEECLEEMKMVRFGQLNIEDIGTRTAGWPFLSNVTNDIHYDYSRIRVEMPLSEPSPTQYGQLVDWNSAYYLEVW